MDTKTIQLLQQIVGKEQLITTPEELLCYSFDGSALEYPPAAVAFPQTTEEVSRVMRLASERLFPVVPRGAGTGMTGGALAVRGGLLLATSRMNRILEIDTENGIATVEPGVLTGDLKAAVAKHGLYYPPDPASFRFCTMGGNVAECAGGPSAVKYGVTRDYVLALQVVLADGRILSTGERTAKGVVGYDLTRLFTGSEGTLGIITRITVRLLAQPQKRQTLLVLFDSLAQATTLVSKILRFQLPCTLEYMDRTAISIVSDKFPFTLPQNTAALLLLELDGEARSVETQAETLEAFLKRENPLLLRTATDEADAAALWNARRAISPAAFKLKPHKLSEDIVVPRSRVADLVAFAEKLAGDLALTIFTFGHAGDGNIHVNIMVDKEDGAEYERGQRAKSMLFKETVRLGGTISGEHGVGITKAAFLPLEVDEVRMSVMRDLKKLFDPNDILNPGKIFPDEQRQGPSQG